MAKRVFRSFPKYDDCFEDTDKYINMSDEKKQKLECKRVANYLKTEEMIELATSKILAILSRLDREDFDSVLARVKNRKMSPEEIREIKERIEHAMLAGNPA